jgi:DNA ligase-associated metallophosphoesterase
LRKDYKFTFLNQDLILLPEKAIYWEQQNALLLADLHLGKVGHFRKQGIAIPGDGTNSDYEILSFILDSYPIEKIYVLGDLFHSEYNKELDIFSQWQNNYPSLKIVLIKGNHDILPDSFYHKNNLAIIDEKLKVPPFIFSHQTLENPNYLYNLSGHIHPAVELRGKGKQSLTLSCFYFGNQFGLLPAFGRYTGKCKINIQPKDQVFAVVENKVIAIES